MYLCTYSSIKPAFFTVFVLWNLGTNNNSLLQHKQAITTDFFIHELRVKGPEQYTLLEKKIKDKMAVGGVKNCDLFTLLCVGIKLIQYELRWVI